VEDLLPEVEEGVAAGGSLSEVVKDVAQRRGVSRRKLYEAALRDRDGA
jgi:hypothetical protein